MGPTTVFHLHMGLATDLFYMGLATGLFYTWALLLTFFTNGLLSLIRLSITHRSPISAAANLVLRGLSALIRLNVLVSFTVSTIISLY